MTGRAIAASRGEVLLGYLLMVSSAACWGLATVMSKHALIYAPPITLVVLQLTASVAFLLVLLRLSGISLTLTRLEKRAALSGVLEPGLAYAFGVAGLNLTSATNASLISATEPILVIVLALLIFGVRTDRRNVLAISVAVTGVMLASFGGTGEADGLEIVRAGDGLIVIATLFAALYVVVSSRLVGTISPMLLAFLQQLVGWSVAVVIALVAIGIGAERPEMSALVDGAGWIVTSGLVQYAFAFLLYLQALRYLPVGVAAVFLTLIPVFGVGGAVLFLGESVNLSQWLGGALIVGAIAACRSR